MILCGLVFTGYLCHARRRGQGSKRLFSAQKKKKKKLEKKHKTRKSYVGPSKQGQLVRHCTYLRQIDRLTARCTDPSAPSCLVSEPSGPNGVPVLVLVLLRLLRIASGGCSLLTRLWRSASPHTPSRRDPAKAFCCFPSLSVFFSFSFFLVFSCCCYKFFFLNFFFFFFSWPFRIG